MAETVPAPPRFRKRRLPRQPSLVGPLFYFDLVRLARRGRSTLLRCGYALALFAVLYFTYAERFPYHNLLAAPLESPRSMPATEMPALALGFVRAIVWLQTAAIFVLTPAYLASAVAEEKERGTLELLLTTRLTDREIVLGKMAARVTHLGGILLAGVPLLALTQLWGGVDVRLLVAAFVATALNLLAVAAICVFCSVHARTVLGAVLASYALTAVALVPCVALMATPGGVFEQLAERPPPNVPLRFSGMLVRTLPPPPPSRLDYFAPMVPGVLVNGLVIAGAAAMAVWGLRPAAGLPAGELIAGSRSPPEPRPPLIEGWGPFDDRGRPYDPRVVRLPPVGDWPLLWKETYGERETATPEFERWAAGDWRRVPVLVLAAAAPLAGLHWLGRNEPNFLKAVGSIGRIAVLLPACVWCAVLAFRASAGVSRERDMRTLEGLLLLPVSRATVLGAKWLGPVLYGRSNGYLLAAVIVLGLLSGALHPLGAILLVAALAAHVAFLASLCVWLSVASRTTLWARVTTALVLLAFLGGGLRQLGTHDTAGDATRRVAARSAPGLRSDTQEEFRPPWRFLVAEVGANAPGAWWFLAFSWEDFADAVRTGDSLFAARLGVAACGILAYGLLAGVLWLVAWRRFASEQTR